jgi:hypothetical protein
MKSVICLALIGLFVATAPVHADQGRGNKNFKTVNSSTKAETSTPAVSIHVTFSSRDVEVIRTHYASQYRGLPPGLQKKVARGGQLPPGWQKKMEPFPASLDRVLVPLPGGYKRGVYDGHAVIYDPLTHAIMDIIQLVV